MNLLGLNLRGKTVTFTFKNIDAYPSTNSTISLLQVLDTSILADSITVGASLIYPNGDGTGYYYYDRVYVDNTSLSVDSYELPPITYNFSDDRDYLVHVYDQNYVSCDLTEDDLYTAISGKWEITNPQSLSSIQTNFTEEVNFTSFNTDWTHAYINCLGTSIYLEYQKFVNGDYENISTVASTDSDTGELLLSEHLAVLDFGETPQKVTKHFVRCLELIADPILPATTTIRGKWKLNENLEDLLDSLGSIDQTQNVSFKSNSNGYTGINVKVDEAVYIKYVNQDGSDIKIYEKKKGDVEYDKSYAVLDFGKDSQEVTQEFYDIFSLIAYQLQISGVWKVTDTYGTAPAPDTIQNVNFTVNGRQGIKLEFQDLAGTNAYCHLVKYYCSDGTSWMLTSPADTIVDSSFIDFGEEPQEVSEDFLIWINHMAEPWAKVSGMWIFNTDFDDRMLPQNPNDVYLQCIYEEVGFRTDAENFTHIEIGTSYYGRALFIYYYTGEGDYQLVATGQDGQGMFENDQYRYLQFGETQYVSPLFKEFLEANATEAGEYAIDKGDYCFKLDIYNEVCEIAQTYGGIHDIMIPYTVQVKNADGSDPDECYYMCTMNHDGVCSLTYDTAGRGSYYMYEDTPAEFRSLGWATESGGSFQGRHIKVSEKTYLNNSEYTFLSKVLIPLNPNRFLDTVGTWAMAQDMKTITDRTIKYAKYMKYTPVADILYYNESGASSVSGLDFSKYLFATIKARACGTFSRPTSTSFATRTITDKGGSFTMQIADPAHYVAWNVTNTSITKSTSSTSGYLIYEIIGYRWEAALTSIPEEETPSYSYNYVRGQLTCAQGKYFNNFYNYDGGTEFRVELNFRVNKLGVELVNNSVEASNGLAYWKLSINENGNLVMDNCYAGDAKNGSVTWTEFTVTPGVWYTLSLYSNNLTSENYSTTAGKVNVSIVPFTTSPTHSYVTKKISRWSQVSGTRNMYIGGDNVDLRNDLLIRGTKYHSGITNTQSELYIDIVDATIGGQLSDISNGTFTLVGGYVYGVES